VLGGRSELAPPQEDGAENGQRRSFVGPVADLPAQGQGVLQVLGGRSQLAPHPISRAENGQRPGFGESVADLPGEDRVGARLALLAAVAPSAVSVGDVALWRMFRPADADLVGLFAFGALTATDHVEAALSAVSH